ncbi:helix-turn-helix transcriptional regulator [Neobacillus sp. YIM B06451]|uniref:helix-turn-helix domain-containing protein n=1 Tax=Neobacillus sp. YIM B06451 TaxID=3070994 RepID=UPI00292F50F8|nr:helix-turn-helix transcriptional regulator [Neobacillus sp. YIM B06451]
MEEILYIEIGKLIKKARLLRNLTQQELSESINITRASIANIERGNQKISLLTLYEVAESLNVSPKSLLPDLEVLNKPKYDVDLYVNIDSLKDKLSSNEIEWVYQIMKKTEYEEGVTNEDEDKD